MVNQVLIRHPINWGLDEKKVVELAKKALRTRGFKSGVELSLWFVGKTKAKQLNLKFRDKDYIPQVLGFPMSKMADADGIIRLGDVVICTQKLKYEAGLKRVGLEKVLGEWLIHGVDNLLK